MLNVTLKAVEAEVIREALADLVVGYEKARLVLLRDKNPKQFNTASCRTLEDRIKFVKDLSYKLEIRG